MNLRKMICLALAMVMMVAALTACGGGDKPAETKPAETKPAEGQETTAAEPQGEKIYRLLSVMAASTANPHVASTSYDDEISMLINGNLYMYMPNEKRDGIVLEPNLAVGEPEKMDADGKVWRIKIDENAKWSNGEPINADTFMYSWQMALDPKLLNPPAISLAKNYIEIENAESYYTQEADGNTVDWETLGIKKIDDQTIEITTVQKYLVTDVMRHFTVRVTMAVYEPMYEELMNDTRSATQYGTDKDKIVAAGPFVLTEWVKGAERVFEKNPEYLHADQIKLDGINVKIVQDTGTQLQMFENGELDYIELSAAGYAKYEEDPRVVQFPSRAVRQVEINRTHPDKKILGNKNFRQALYYAQDRATMAKLGNHVPAAYYVPTTSTALPDGTKFRDLPKSNEYLPANHGYDPVKAKELFDIAMEEEGLDKISLTLNYYESREDVKMMAEYQQKTMTELFGADKFELKLQAMPNNQLFDTMKASQNDLGSYELSWGSWSWGASDFSPNRQFEVFQSDYPRRNANYGNAELDKLYLESVSEDVRLDPNKIIDYAMDMEKVYIDDVLAVPVFQAYAQAMFSERVILPMDVYDVTFGWGTRLMDIDLTAE